LKTDEELLNHTQAIPVLKNYLAGHQRRCPALELRRMRRADFTRNRIHPWGCLDGLDARIDGLGISVVRRANE